MCKNNTPVRLIDEIGRIVLPIEIRKAMEWGEKTPIELWMNTTDNEVVIKRHTFTCTYCGGTEKLKEYQRKHICPDCRKAIAEL